jgi:hypothetical protein
MWQRVGPGMYGKPRGRPDSSPIRAAPAARGHAEPRVDSPPQMPRCLCGSGGAPNAPFAASLAPISERGQDVQQFPPPQRTGTEPMPAEGKYVPLSWPAERPRAAGLSGRARKRLRRGLECVVQQRGAIPTEFWGADPRRADVGQRVCTIIKFARCPARNRLEAF